MTVLRIWRSPCFHTTMVLTQLKKDSKDWSLLLFPYHYGSHATQQKESSACLQGKQFPYHYGSHATEWLDRNGNIPFTFPYHYGSHATKGGGEWGFTTHLRFHTTMVLTQPCAYVWFIANTTCVSIPLWFSRNGTKVVDYYSTNVFPYHYGSHATQCSHIRVWAPQLFPYHYGSHATEWIPKGGDCMNLSFHTTMVLTQLTKCSWPRWRRPSSFHTTMVLTQPNHFAYQGGFEREVSIPLWFSRNGESTWSLKSG